MARRPESISKFIAPGVICAFAVLMLVWTYEYQPAMRRLPLLVAWSTIKELVAMAALDCGFRDFLAAKRARNADSHCSRLSRNDRVRRRTSGNRM